MPPIKPEYEDSSRGSTNSLERSSNSAFAFQANPGRPALTSNLASIKSTETEKAFDFKFAYSKDSKGAHWAAKEKKSLFSALEQESSVIDFAEAADADYRDKSSELKVSETFSQAPKRKKIRIVHPSQKSLDSFVKSAANSESSSRESESVLSPDMFSSTKTSSSSLNCKQQTTAPERPDQRANRISKYLKEVNFYSLFLIFFVNVNSVCGVHIKQHYRNLILSISQYNFGNKIVHNVNVFSFLIILSSKIQ